MNLGNPHSTSKSDSINNTSAPNRFLSQRAQVTLVIVLLIAFTLWNMPQPILLSDQETRQLLTLGPLPEPPLDPTNRWSGNAQAANFGHDLFFSTSLSFNNSVSCATCHKPELYFTDVLWPEFDTEQMALALEWFQTRQRRFGRVNGSKIPA